MDIKDVKVGMLVQMNNNARHYVGYVGTVSSIDYKANVATLKLEGLNKPWTVFTYRFNEYQDPEADMVVWDALEVGEHFITEADFKAIKINMRQYVVIGGSMLHTMGVEPVYQVRKFRLA